VVRSLEGETPETVGSKDTDRRGEEDGRKNNHEKGSRREKGSEAFEYKREGVITRNRLY
jgi:hypothetical protein